MRFSDIVLLREGVVEVDSGQPPALALPVVVCHKPFVLLQSYRVFVSLDTVRLIDIKVFLVVN